MALNCLSSPPLLILTNAFFQSLRLSTRGLFSPFPQTGLKIWKFEKPSSFILEYVSVAVCDDFCCCDVLQSSVNRFSTNQHICHIAAQSMASSSWQPWQVGPWNVYIVTSFLRHFRLVLGQDLNFKFTSKYISCLFCKLQNALKGSNRK